MLGSDYLARLVIGSGVVKLLNAGWVTGIRVFCIRFDMVGALEFEVPLERRTEAKDLILSFDKLRHLQPVAELVEAVTHQHINTLTPQTHHQHNENLPGRSNFNFV